MGIEVKNLNIENIEKRYMELRIKKGDGVGEAFILVETGYYADDLNKKNWTKIISEEIHLPNDLLNILVSMNSTTLGIPADKASVGALLETLVYGIISGAIPTKAKITLYVKDSLGNPVEATVKLTYNSRLIYDNEYKAASTHLFDFLPVMLGVRVDVSAPGFITSTTTVNTWYGEKTVNITLTPVE